MLFFYLFFTVVVAQRIVELVIARKNEYMMKSKGAKEYGQSHYKFMVMIHTLFFLSLLIEGGILSPSINRFWPWLLALFFITQIGRIWVINSLGEYWNTKIIVLPNADVVVKGPYRFIKHPNYFIVTIEFFVIPLLFNAYWTMFLFALLNQVILSIRIPLEERALREGTNYRENHEGKARFIPILSRMIDNKMSKD